MTALINVHGMRNVFVLAAAAVALLGSCAVYRHPRFHRHHPHRHRVVIVAERAAAAGQDGDCTMSGECYAMPTFYCYAKAE